MQIIKSTLYNILTQRKKKSLDNKRLSGCPNRDNERLFIVQNASENDINIGDIVAYVNDVVFVGDDISGKKKWALTDEYQSSLGVVTNKLTSLSKDSIKPAIYHIQWFDGYKGDFPEADLYDFKELYLIQSEFAENNE